MSIFPVPIETKISRKYFEKLARHFQNTSNNSIQIKIIEILEYAVNVSTVDNHIVSPMTYAIVCNNIQKSPISSSKDNSKWHLKLAKILLVSNIHYHRSAKIFNMTLEFFKSCLEESEETYDHIMYWMHIFSDEIDEYLLPNGPESSRTIIDRDLKEIAQMICGLIPAMLKPTFRRSRHIDIVLILIIRINRYKLIKKSSPIIDRFYHFLFESQVEFTYRCLELTISLIKNDLVSNDIISKLIIYLTNNIDDEFLSEKLNLIDILIEKKHLSEQQLDSMISGLIGFCGIKYQYLPSNILEFTDKYLRDNVKLQEWILANFSHIDHHSQTFINIIITLSDINDPKKTKPIFTPDFLDTIISLNIKKNKADIHSKLFTIISNLIKNNNFKQSNVGLSLFQLLKKLINNQDPTLKLKSLNVTLQIFQHYKILDKYKNDKIKYH